MTKDLKDKAIDFKGKKYVLVSDRVLYFNEQYPDGSIETELLSNPDAEMVVVKAIVTIPKNIKHSNFCNKTKFNHGTSNDPTCNCEPTGIQGVQKFTGLSQAVWGEGYINKTSALENAETSAVGRALAFMGIGVLDSIASIDEINKTSHGGKKPTTKEYQEANRKAYEAGEEPF